MTRSPRSSPRRSRARQIAPHDAPVVIREATEADLPAILGLIQDLAAHEKASDQVLTTEADLRRMLMDGEHGVPPLAHCLVAEAGGSVVGLALWFVTTSTWTGTHGIWLEDLYVRPEVRGSGIGQALLGELAAICTDRGYARLEWWVLDWNTSAIEFYESLGSQSMDEWTVRRLDGQELTDVAQSRAALRRAPQAESRH